MKFNPEKIISRCSKVRTENGKQIRYEITDDSYEDEYGSYQYDYHAWRLEEGLEPKNLTAGCYRYTESDAKRFITFGKWENCPTCGHSHFVEEKS